GSVRAVRSRPHNGAGFIKQLVVERTAFRRNRNAALFDFTKTGCVRTGSPLTISADKRDFFFQSFERSLTEKNRTIAGWRAFDNSLWIDAAFRHLGLYGVNVERTRGKVVDMRTLERNNICNQPMRIMQALIQVFANIGTIMPTESFQDFRNKRLCFFLAKTALGFGFFDESNRAGSENITFC